MSREFVAGQMGLPYDEIRAIEDGRREVNAEEFDLQEYKIFLDKANWIWKK